MRTLLLLWLTACSGDPVDDTAADAAAPWSPTPGHGAGTAALSLTVSGRDAPIPARVWYPSAQHNGALPLADLVADPADRATLAALVDDAPAGCPTEVHPAVEGEAAAGVSAPVLVYSHCHTCLGLSGATVAATLARHGFVVVAPDHVGNTLFDALEGGGGSLDEETLAQRAADASAALDAVLAGEGLPAGLTVDPGRVGAVGHSFGAVTVGRLLRDDPRVQAAVAMGAPIDNPLLVGVDAESVTAPLLLLLLEEDNSIGTLGNDLIVRNFEEVSGPAWLASMPDAGHWSVSDLCGVIDDFQPGCGLGDRMSGGAEFAYIDPDDGRATAGALSAAFFAHALQGDAAAGAWLAAPEAAAAVTVTVR